MNPSANAAVDSAPPVGWRWAPAWVLAYAALWPASRVSEAVLSLGALAALFLLAKARFRDGNRLLSSGAWALTTALFFAYWLPQLISTFDAADPRGAIGKTLAGLRYLPFLWLVAISVATRSGRRIVFGGIAILLLLWSIDLLLQALSGHSVLFDGLNALYAAIKDKGICEGQAARGFDRFNGIFGTCNPVLGVVLASFSPFLLYAGHRRFGIQGWVAAAFVVGLAIMLAGSRASWLTYALVLVFSGWHVLGWKRLAGVFAAGAIALAVLAMMYPPLGDRLARTATILQDGGGNEVDIALSGRGKIWGAAACMIREHPLNGVGVRDFREAYPACDPSPGVKPEWGEGPALHAHQLVLEVLSETGLIGLLMWLAGAALAWRAWRFASAEAKRRARPAMLALAVTVFPFNTHLAFYSSFWGGVTLLLIALYAGSLMARDEPAA